MTTLSKTFFAVMLLAALTACQTQEQKQQALAAASVKEYLKGKLTDGASYEAVKFSKLDTLTLKAYVAERIEIRRSDSAFVLENLAKPLADTVSLKSHQVEILQELDSMKKLLPVVDPNAIKEITVKHQYKCKNAFNAVVTNNIFVTLTPDLKVESVRELDSFE